MKHYLTLTICTIFLYTFFVLPAFSQENMHQWEIRSIDTMKYSRDVSREKLSDQQFEHTIDRQVMAIAKTGANYIAISTPYDEEFYPFLRKWVQAARRYKLKVWFRGNFSGWEGWFEYPRIGREEHIQKTETFILSHPEIFMDGDIFASCHECEHGAPHNPDGSFDVAAHRDFLLEEYVVSKRSFEKIDKKVRANYFSMNIDLAKEMMNPETVRALDGVIVIDHYTETPDQLAKDVTNLAALTGAKIALGEFGAPIPNINGSFTENEQAVWIDAALSRLSEIPALIAVNYWTNVGGSTAIWYEDGGNTRAVSVLTKYYTKKDEADVSRDNQGLLQALFTFIRTLLPV